MFYMICVVLLLPVLTRVIHFAWSCSPKLTPESSNYQTLNLIQTLIYSWRIDYIPGSSSSTHRCWGASLSAWEPPTSRHRGQPGPGPRWPAQRPDGRREEPEQLRHGGRTAALEFRARTGGSGSVCSPESHHEAAATSMLLNHSH